MNFTHSLFNYFYKNKKCCKAVTDTTRQRKLKQLFIRKCNFTGHNLSSQSKTELAANPQQRKKNERKKYRPSNLYNNAVEKLHRLSN